MHNVHTIDSMSIIRKPCTNKWTKTSLQEQQCIREAKQAQNYQFNAERSFRWKETYFKALGTKKEKAYGTYYTYATNAS